MRFPLRFSALFVFPLLLFPIYSTAARQTVVKRISVSANDPMQVEVQTSAAVAPEVQFIVNPERLVIDVPSAVPGAGLHNQNINRSQVKRVRVGLFSSVPPITRIVLDLNSPQPYRIAATASGFTVTVGLEDPQPATTSNNETPSTEPIVGWVSASAPSIPTAQPQHFVIETAPQQPAKTVIVDYANGQLEIHAHNATLSDVLSKIQEQTGAEITIPPLTREEHVIGDFGPASASQVLAQLLNGLDMNFVVVGSPADPNILRSVILTPKSADFAESQPSDAQPAVANNAQPANPDAPLSAQPNAVVPAEDLPQPPPPDDNPAPPPPDPPQN